MPGLLESDIEELRERGVESSIDATALREFLKRGEYTVHADPKVSLLTMLQMAPMLHRFYIEMKWTVLHTSSSTQFVTSDNPVVKFDPEYRGGGIAFASPTIQVKFPVTKSAMLVVTHDRTREETWHQLVRAGRQDEAKVLRETLPLIDYLDVQPSQVKAMNRHTTLYTERFAYAPDRDSELVELLRGESQAVRIRFD